MAPPRGSENFPPERLLLFSDAVVAIAITLLALELPVPTGNSSHEFLTSLRHNDGRYLAFATSFVVIAIAWSQHRRIWAFAEWSDSFLVRTNMVWLFTIVLIPFATSMLHGASQQSVTTHAYRFGFYSLLEVVDDGAILLLARHIVTAGLLRPDIDRQRITRTYWSLYGGIAGFGLAIPLLFATRFGWVMWIIGPMVVSQVARRRPPDHTHGPSVGR
jgi:uncharacterized membrane protein